MGNKGERCPALKEMGATLCDNILQMGLEPHMYDAEIMVEVVVECAVLQPCYCILYHTAV